MTKTTLAGQQGRIWLQQRRTRLANGV